MKIQLSEHFTYKKLLRFVLPSIIMMIFTSIYGIVDGLFVSNYVGKTAFAAVNLVMPLMMASWSVPVVARSWQRHSAKANIKKQTNISRCLSMWLSSAVSSSVSAECC